MSQPTDPLIGHGAAVAPNDVPKVMRLARYFDLKATPRKGGGAYIFVKSRVQKE